ncbi:MAG: ribonuclease III [Acholeplasmataceae bacterium]|nr:ribonuclease III [Acholeplasmataceae bacterium]
MNGLTLAYIGDAYYELCIRRYLLDKKITSVNQLHKTAIKFTQGESQSKIVMAFIESNELTEDEVSLYKRGRNASGPGRKNTDAKTYHQATGFESLIGGLYLEDQTRCNQLIDKAIKLIESGDLNGKNS